MNEDDRRFYAERLEALWGRYVAFVNFVVTISGGTVLVLVAKLVELRVEERALLSVPSLVWLALMVAVLTAVYSIFWRALAHRYMEYEILAPFPPMAEYIGEKRVRYCVTDPHRFERVERWGMRAAYKFAPWVVGAGLLVS